MEGIDLNAKTKISFDKLTPLGLKGGQLKTCSCRSIYLRCHFLKAQDKLGRLKSGDLGGNRTPNTRLRTAVFYPLNYQAIHYSIP